MKKLILFVFVALFTGVAVNAQNAQFVQPDNTPVTRADFGYDGTQQSQTQPKQSDKVRQVIEQAIEQHPEYAAKLRGSLELMNAERGIVDQAFAASLNDANRAAYLEMKSKGLDRITVAVDGQSFVLTAEEFISAGGANPKDSYKDLDGNIVQSTYLDNLQPVLDARK